MPSRWRLQQPQRVCCAGSLLPTKTAMRRKGHGRFATRSMRSLLLLLRRRTEATAEAPWGWRRCNESRAPSKRGCRCSTKATPRGALMSTKARSRTSLTVSLALPRIMWMRLFGPCRQERASARGRSAAQWTPSYRAPSRATRTTPPATSPGASQQPPSRAPLPPTPLASPPHPLPRRRSPRKRTPRWGGFLGGTSATRPPLRDGGR
mmetsp:Transcript_20723/g.50111  ORF Transcript_20723/g.50111 Transcript_20723/m.50111 type:complete len:207 (-) Transcript_20723:664-1284(-)